MRKVVKIGGIDCVLKSSAAVPRMYRIKFGRDIFVDLTSLRKELAIQENARREATIGEDEDFESTMPIAALELFENIAFIMHKHGDPNQPKEIDEWLEQFEIFDVYKVLPSILELWGMETKELSEPKKENEK